MANTKKTTIFRKKPATGATGRVVASVLRGGGAYGANAAMAALEEKVPKKFSGPACFLVGVAGDYFLDGDSPFLAVTQGIGVSGALGMGEALLPENMKNTFGLSGVGATQVDATPDWTELADQVGYEEVGYEDDSSISGVEEYMDTEPIGDDFP